MTPRKRTLHSLEWELHHEETRRAYALRNRSFFGPPGLRGFLKDWEALDLPPPPRGDNRLNCNLGSGAKWKLGRTVE